MVECTEDRDTVSGLVCLAAQMAFEVCVCLSGRLSGRLSVHICLSVCLEH